MDIKSVNKNLVDSAVILELDVSENKYDYSYEIESAISLAKYELELYKVAILENINTIDKLTPHCDKNDYIIAATTGVICGIFDVFLVGKPGESLAGDISDKWFENRTKDFAKICGWNDKNNNSLSSAKRHLEKIFKVPYDQTGVGDAGREVYDLNTKNHHFKSLGHNSTLLGLFFSILDQFQNTSHFVSNGEVITLMKANDKFELRGNNFESRLFCGFVNWFGHLISDISGSSSSNGRGMGIPSPFLTWINEIIVIKGKLHIPITELDKYLNEMAIKIYTQGYDIRFNGAQITTVVVNEFIIRFLYSFRRLIKYIAETKKEEIAFSRLWKACEPFSNTTVKRMLTVAHGTFCVIDIGDAVARAFVSGGGHFNIVEFVLRLNIAGLGRFSISLYGDINTMNKSKDISEEIYFLERRKSVIEDYILGLEVLSKLYDDEHLLNFTDDLKKSDMLYKQAFGKSVLLAEKRNVDDGLILKNKSDIDNYFNGGNNI